LTFIALLLTSTFLVIGTVLIFRNASALTWDRVDGTLLDAHLERKGPPGNSTPEMPIVRYKYTYLGTEYTGTSWSPAGLGARLKDELREVQSESPLQVWVNPHSPGDAALVRLPLSIGFFPLVFGLGLFVLFVIGLGGGMLYSALHPEKALDPNSPVRIWIKRTLRIGIALLLCSAMGAVAMTMQSPGGWWEWVITIVLTAYAATRRITPQNVTTR
jgi:hypothetical protein